MSASFDSYSEAPLLNQSLPQQVIESLLPEAKQWGLEGYHVPRKTQLFTTREHKVPTAKLRSLFTEAEKKAKDPGPSNYSPTSEQLTKRYWLKTTGKFARGKRQTLIDDVIKRSPAVPGPGAYNKLEKGKVEQSPNKILLGVMNKTQGVNFLSNMEFLGEESPGVGKYFEQEDDRKKAYAIIEERKPVFKYTPL